MLFECKKRVLYELKNNKDEKSADDETGAEGAEEEETGETGRRNFPGIGDLSGKAARRRLFL